MFELKNKTTIPSDSKDYSTEATSFSSYKDNEKGMVSEQSQKGSVIALIAALLGFFMITLDAVIVNVALPEMGQDLGGGITGLQWIVDGYTLMFAALLLSAGALTDQIGAKKPLGLD
jgi:hypothetical protein